MGHHDAVDVRAIIDTRGLRRRRYERLARLVELRPSDRVVDVGCGRGGGTIAAYNRTNPVVGVDLLPAGRVTLVQANFSYLRADATDLSAIADGAFDVAFSIGLLEHIRPEDRLVAAIRELQRIASRYAVIVPHRYAFIEPHFQMPLFSVWPDAIRSAAIRRVRLGTQDRQPDGRWQRINWLSAKAWLDLFADPTARTYRHWYGPLLEYTIIVGGPRRPADAKP